MDKPLPPPPFPLRRTLLVGAALVALAFASWSAFFAYRLTTPARRPVGAVPADFPYPVETVKFAARDGVRLSGWLVPCPGATRAAVLLHGNGRNRTGLTDHAKLLRAHGYAVLLYDARGHGESGDAPCSFGWHEAQDLLGALDFLRGRGLRQFGLLGISQGGITIALAASRLRDLAWVVLECTPARVSDVFEHDSRRTLGAPAWLADALAWPLIEWRLGTRLPDYAPRDTVAQLHCPVFVIAGATR